MERICKCISKNSFPLIKYMNKKILSKINRAIVLGGSFKDLLDGYVFRDRIRVVKNFFSSDLLMSEDEHSK